MPAQANPGTILSTSTPTCRCEITTSAIPPVRERLNWTVSPCRPRLGVIHVVELNAVRALPDIGSEQGAQRQPRRDELAPLRCGSKTGRSLPLVARQHVGQDPIACIQSDAPYVYLECVEAIGHYLGVPEPCKAQCGLHLH